VVRTGFLELVEVEFELAFKYMKGLGGIRELMTLKAYYMPSTLTFLTHVRKLRLK
jgi:hypothetical protein